MQNRKPHRPPAHASSRARSAGRGESRRGSVSAGTASAHAVGHLIEIGVAAGIRRDILADAAGVTDNELRDPDARVPLAAEIAIWQTLATHVGDPEFGIRAAGAHSWRAVGLVGYTARFSTTLRGALHRVQRYGRIFTEAVEFRLEEGLPQVALASAHPALGPGHAVAEGYRLAALLRASRELTGVDITPANATFTYLQPPTTTAHRQLFRCPLNFGAPTASLAFRVSDLDLAVVGSDDALAGYLGKYADQMLASLARGEMIRHRVRPAIWSLLGDGVPTLKDVAAALRMPARTLQRRLAAEDTSLRREIDEMRKTMAIAVLRDRSVVIEDVASLLGYSDPSTFFRSFKRWTGSTPRQFRGAAV